MPFRGSAPSSFPLSPATCLSLLLAALLPGCGRSGREHAREEIRQSGHALTIDDFVKAAGNGDVPLVEAYQQAGLDRNGLDTRGFSPLMAAAMNGKTAAAKALLDENARPDLQNPAGDTALILAAAADQPETVRLLIESNADLRIRNHDRLTALLKAANLKRARAIEVLLATSRDALAKDGQIDRALIVAALLDSPPILNQLLDKGGNVNARIENGQTALMFAASFGRKDIVETLLARGADPKLVDKDGENASVLALGHGFPDLAKFIDGRTPGGDAVAATAAVTPPALAPDAVPGASPTPPPTPTEAQVKQAANDAASVAMERAWLKQNGVEPVTLLKKDTGQDDDGDGFTNDEELAAGTDPNDPKSHPPYYTKLRMKRLDGDAFPVTFDDYDAKTKKVRVRVRDKMGSGLGGTESGERRVELGQGDTVPGQPYKVTKLRLHRTTEKDTARPLDMSELTLTDPQSGRKVVLVKGMPASSPDAGAVLALTLPGDDREIRVRQGETFSLPREPDTRLEVIDIRPTQVILKVVGSGQTVTVEKEK